MKVLIAAGGTGGHIFPALAIARALRKKGPGINVEFVGTGERLEAEWLGGEGFFLHQMRIRGLQGKKGMGLIGSLALLPRAFSQSWAILSRFRPDIAVGVGGYVSGPLLLLAALRRIPTLIHEQNFFPGLTNRLLSLFVQQIACSFPQSECFFPGKRRKIAFTGNPIRREILKGERYQAAGRFGMDPDRFTVLSFGGSQGASKINFSLLGALPRLLPVREELQFLHASGEKDFSAMIEGFTGHNFRAKVYPFIQDMVSAYALADLVISRAGATTIAELAALGKPSILVPYPYAANDHQRYNAEALARLGGARMILDRDLNGSTLAQVIEGAIRDQRGRELMGIKARSLARVDADDQVADLIMKLAS